MVNTGCVVVTNEKHRVDRSINNRAGTNVPDVCETLGIGWLYLADFITTENL